MFGASPIYLKSMIRLSCDVCHLIFSILTYYYASSPGVPLWSAQCAWCCGPVQPNHQAPHSLFPALRRRSATAPGDEAGSSDITHWHCIGFFIFIVYIFLYVQNTSLKEYKLLQSQERLLWPTAINYNSFCCTCRKHC